MDDKLAKQLVRQLKIINFWITTFGVLFLLLLGFIGFFMYKTMVFIHDTTTKMEQIQQTTTEKLDVKKQTCNTTGSVGDYLRNNTNFCK